MTVIVAGWLQLVVIGTICQVSCDVSCIERLGL
jgi:hypothetical protein